MMRAVDPPHDGRVVRSHTVMMMLQRRYVRRHRGSAEELAGFQLINSQKACSPAPTCISHDGFSLTNSSETLTRGSRGTIRCMTPDLSLKQLGDVFPCESQSALG
jgi:hypothetical protein